MLKIGDRVSVYDGGYGYTGTIDAIDTQGRVRTSCRPGWIHPKQCRRLKPKAKPREFEVSIGTDGNPLGVRIPGQFRVGNFISQPHETILVREVRNASQSATRAGTE